MIRLTRSRAPRDLPAGLTGPGLLEKNLGLLEEIAKGVPRGKQAFSSRHWKPAKTRLLAESFGKCGYCEAATTAVAFGDVEHYRPKSVYWWLAYCCDNYLAACTQCNQAFKVDHFPVAGRRLPDPVGRRSLRNAASRAALAPRVCPDPCDEAAVARLVAAGAREKPLLPNPYYLDPESLFGWKPDDVHREVALVPGDGSRWSARVVEAVNSYYGLNRLELRRLRWETYDPLSTVVSLVETVDLPPSARGKALSLVARMLAPEHPFAGMCRYFVRRVWKVPGA